MNWIIANRWTIRSNSAVASRQVSVLGLCFLKLNGIVRGTLDGDYSVQFLFIVKVYTHQFLKLK